jgi:hypothetical protein
LLIHQGDIQAKVGGICGRGETRRPGAYHE